MVFPLLRKHCLLLIVPILFLIAIPLIYSSIGGGVDHQFGIIDFVKESEFANVTIVQSITFTENTSLIEDVQLLDKIIAEEEERRKTMQTSTTAVPESRAKSRIRDTIDDNELLGNYSLSIRVLLIGDHSLYETFVELQRGDEFAAYHSLRLYLQGILDQLRTIFSHWTFFDNQKLDLELAKIIPIFRPEDCPLRGPIVRKSDEYFHYNLINGTRSDNINATLLSSDYFDGDFVNVTDVPEWPTNETVSHHSWRTIDGLEAVHVIRSWAEENKRILPAYEHVIVITRYDLMSQNNDSATQGMAYVGAMCSGSNSASVVEDVGGLSTVVIAAHEMAHSLGAFHDGSNANCSARNNFLMSPSSSGSEFGNNFDNAFMLSDCSLAQIENFLRSNDSACLRQYSQLSNSENYNTKFTNIKDKITESEIKKKPGEVFDINKQCKLAFGPTYGVCRRRDYYYHYISPSADKCRRLWCKDRRLRRYAPCETKAFIPLMDGTKCSQSGWCIKGKCVHNECVDINPSYCAQIPRAMRRIFCNVSSFAKICCNLCQDVAKKNNKVQPNIAKPTKKKTKWLFDDL
ncbi:reprolysin (M12B) family zinc metalloprotease domain-containing protein [Ditylenchus destructor]|uniref:Reprolysin (M12B) family zinc metalloprotease domain-containing protein n=1 Tax=Ditylenchus destructor TaxID=166010 RepID=A0AAD4RB14_9BILA|nr:reprolysin (M12B) family zinc metalloprotease domain-containing protein [Ditylenchus destructor]